MRFHAKKVYGQSKLSNCTFCGRTATQKTEVGLEVCYLHTKEQLNDIKCTCGSWLEQRSGKFGPYFNCLRCGNVNFKKAMEIKAITATKESAAVKATSTSPQKFIPKETIITSRDVQYFD
ncbi:MAG TPA: hypothetical protein VJI32_00120 [Candidatus Nanoarchaeia archaeon]|nr:hypothetical protein [Candidatus Nanoarchaeia archaeon]